MHPVTRIYWTHGYGKFRQPKRMRKENTGRILLMNGTDAWLAEFAHYTYTHALHGANSWSVEKTCTVTWLEYASTIGYILEPVL